MKFLSLSVMRYSGLINYWINEFIQMKFGNLYLRDHSVENEDSADLSLAQMLYLFEAYYRGIIACIILIVFELSVSLIKKYQTH